MNSEFVFYQNVSKEDKDEQEKDGDLSSNSLPVIQPAEEKSN